MEAEFIDFLMNQVIVIPVILYVLWRKYKTGRYFPQDDENVKVDPKVWILGMLFFGAIAALAFWVSLLVYGMLFLVLFFVYSFGLLRSKIRECL